MGEIGFDGALVIAITVVFLLLLLLQKASLDALGIGLVVALTATGLVSPEAAVGGFANKAVLTIAGLYVVGEGLTRTGAAEFLGRIFARLGGGSERRIVLVSCAGAALISSFLNDTAVVVVFVPILLDLARKRGIAGSRLLIPLAYASLLGGMCTLVGTSTNLIVSGVAENLGAEPLGMFTMTPVGVAMAAIGIAFIALFARMLLPERQSLTVLMGETPSREYMTEMRIGPESSLIGESYEEAFRRLGLRVLHFVRREEIHRPAGGDERVAADDVVLLQGGIEALAKVDSSLDLKLLHDLKIDPRRMELFEVSLSPRTRWEGVRVADLHLHRDYGATVMAVLRRGRHIHESVGEFRLRAGDLLLLCGDAGSRERLRGSDDFHFLAGEPTVFRFRGRAVVGLAIAGGVVLLLGLGSVLGWKNLPTSSVALGGAVAMVATGALTTKQAYRSIDWSILLFIAGTLALGKAMQETGVADLCADGVLGALAGFGVPAVVGGVILLCFLFNFLISHSAVAVLFTPIAVAAARDLAGDLGHAPGSPEAAAIARALVLAVCFGGSMCFASPIAHQVNLMVMGPGGYRYADYLRLGIPVAIVTGVAATIGIALFTGI